MASTLNVYSASAGSGKTFTLTGEFINILAANPDAYSTILAVTFTNKATAEMKNRILERLYILSSDESQLEIKQASARSALMSLCVDATKLTEKQISTNCKKALSGFLNDFSRFSISTIDSFIQKIIRGFAYEAGLPAQFQIELNQNIVLKNAIDELLAGISNDKDLQEWVLAYTQSEMENNGRWNIEKRLFSLGCELFKDDVHKIDGTNGQLPSRADLRDLCDKLKLIRASYKDGVKSYIDRYNQALDASAVESNMFAGGSRNKLWTIVKTDAGKNYFMDYNGGKFIDYLEKLEEIAAADDADILSKNKKTDTANLEAALPQLKRLAGDYANFVRSNMLDFFTATMVERDIYVVGILMDIRRKIDELARMDNLMLIADTNALLNRIIDDNETPFIYEKIGTRFNNIMIDEFQDTSILQWQNFKPLILNSLSEGCSCLVVGDVKQSIYRWRSSDWRLLSDIGNQVNPYKSQLQVLATNWRSCANIINFNNMIFDNTAATIFAKKIELLAAPLGKEEAARLSNQITDIYKDCSQHVPSSKDPDSGFVSLNFIVDDKEVDTNEIALTKMLESIVMLRDEHRYELKDICVLVRGVIEGRKVVETLIDNNIPVISSDSLVVCNSPAVRLIMSYILYINDSSNDTALAHIVFMHSMPSGTQLDNDDEMYFSNVFTSYWLENRQDIADELSAMKGLAFTEMIEAIVAHIPQWIVDNQIVFVDAFMDAARNFASTQSVNLNDFIEWIDVNGASLVVSVPESQNAVQVMTVHKSKGLEKKAVLIPYLNWQIDKSKGYLWTEMSTSPFNVIANLPMSYSKQLAYTHANKRYIEEVSMRHIDALNLLYVALTRAENVLMMWGVVKEDYNGYDDILCMSDLMYFAIKSIREKPTSDFEQKIADSFNSELNQLQIGEIPKAGKSEMTKETIVLETKKSNPFGSKLSINFESDAFSHINAENKSAVEGNLMHGIMEHIITQSDVEAAVRQAQQAGLINDIEAAYLSAAIKDKISTDDILPWFNGSLKVLVEQPILTRTEISRPDRIMIAPDNSVIVVDYKFGEAHTPKHIAQVHRYVDLLKKMGYQSVSGYIWYFNTNDAPMLV